MAQRPAEKIMRKAYKRGDLALLLLGNRKYRYLPHWSPAPGNTDLALLLSELEELVGEHPPNEVGDCLYLAIKEIVGTHEGIRPVASCLLFDSCERVFDLPLVEIAADLRQSIRVFRSRLEEDKTAGGNGRLQQHEAFAEQEKQASPENST